MYPCNHLFRNHARRKKKKEKLLMLISTLVVFWWCNRNSWLNDKVINSFCRSQIYGMGIHNYQSFEKKSFLNISRKYKSLIINLFFFLLRSRLWDILYLSKHISINFKINANYFCNYYRQYQRGMMTIDWHKYFFCLLEFRKQKCFKCFN